MGRATHGVDHRHRGVMRKSLNVLLACGTDHDDVDHLRQHPSKIFQRLTAPNLCIAGTEKITFTPICAKPASNATRVRVLLMVKINAPVLPTKD